jgi:hypothetical protein
MTRYRFRGIFLLFLMGHATACASRSWQAIDVGVSPHSDTLQTKRMKVNTTTENHASIVDYIESQQPDQVRITTAGGRPSYTTQWVLSFPFVEGDEIVDGDGDLSVPIPEIIQIEEMAINPIATVAKSAGAAILGYTLVVAAVLAHWIAGG